MTKYGVPVIIGLLAEFVLGFVLGFFITSYEFQFLMFTGALLLVIVGGFIAGILSKGGASGGVGIGILMGVINAILLWSMAILALGAGLIPLSWLFAGFAFLSNLSLGFLIGAFGFIGYIVVIVILGLIGGVIGGLLGGEE